jgi:glycosyltransferase involved in cell wall biosynthesis
MSDRVLMIAFHYPPYGGSSGSRRTLAFSSYLPRHGWDPIVLTANTRAYERINADEVGAVPPGVRVVRAFGLDAARHLAIRGRYVSAFALPDRWRTWIPFAVSAGMCIIRRFRPSLIWSTYPIASAHVIGARLAARSGLPWVADMRDPLVETDPFTGVLYPRDPALRQARLDIESEVMRRSSRVVFCTKGARSICIERYGEAAKRFALIPNGYDEEVVQAAEQSLPPPPSGQPAGFRLVHSGTVYPGDDRGPGALFGAIARLRDQGELPVGFRLLLRASGYPAEMAQLIAQYGVQALVELPGPLPYQQALQEMLRADGLLLLQGSASNPAIPAKLYEYLRAQRPILALVHPAGDSAALLRELNASITAPLDDQEQITVALREFLRRCAAGNAPIVRREVAARFSRAAQAAELAGLLREVATQPREAVAL